MTVESTSRQRVYIIAGLSITSLCALWLVTSSSSTMSSSLPVTQHYHDDLDILYQEFPQGKNICESDSFNQGKWVQQTIGLQSNSIDGVSAYAGYHCNWDFPHRCYRREGEFDRSKAM
jgi:hypothetical protein